MWAVICAGLLMAGSVFTVAKTILAPSRGSADAVAGSAAGGTQGGGRPPSGETEEGGGGSTFPQQALNDPWGLSAFRGNCMMCHSVDPDKNAFEFNGFGEDWREDLFETIAPGSDDIFDPSQEQREAASTYEPLLEKDSDGDGYPNGVELMFGSDPGDPESFSTQSQELLSSWFVTVQRVIDRRNISQYEAMPEAVRATADRDRDDVPDLLERFAGTDPSNADSTPLTAARRLAAYRIILNEAGMNVDAAS